MLKEAELMLAALIADLEAKDKQIRALQAHIVRADELQAQLTLK